MRVIYTIGYSGFSIKDFIDTLKKHSINCIIDVRSSPYSKFYHEYDKEVLEKTLKDNNILYRNYDKEFGARQKDKKYYTDNVLDFDKFTSSNQFLDGVNKINNGVDKGYTFALMCAEKDPIDCHRSIMLGKGFCQNKYKVVHIISKQTVELQEELERRLVDVYFPNRFQLNLFEFEMSEKEMVKQAYRKRNRDIGYCDKTEEENE